ncbi:MAG: hypothetical protein LBR19_01185 [Bifidobacteriaceae bacterium]|jgi:tetratricopeptide (TPR) repeat protein|nr:hypothetical protein [Bifidobacteriaceae bacterium]
MARSKSQADDAIHTIDTMPYGRARTAAALAEANRIEAEGPRESLAYALNTLVESYHFGGEPEKAYVPFTRAVALYDQHPELLDETDRHSLFWSFKWMVSSLKDYPTVPAAQIDATLRDMAERFARESISHDAVAHTRFSWLWHQGSPEAAAAFDEWGRQTRDAISNCRLCSESDRVYYMIQNGQVDQGLDLLERTQSDPTIRQECHAEPGFVLTVAALAYAGRGQPGDAAKAITAHRRALAFFEDSSAELASSKARVVEFLARSHNPAAAIRYLEKQQAFLLRPEAPLDRLLFLQQVGAALKVLVDDLGAADQPVHLHEVPATTVGELWAWVQREAPALAAQFDARNGRPACSERLHQAWQVGPFPEPLDLSVVPGFSGAGTESGAGASTAVSTAVSSGGPAGAGASSGSTDTSSASGDAAAVQDDRPAAGLSWEQQDDLLRQAERMARHRDDDLSPAADLYHQAAQAFEQAGRLEEAGFALAEAGQLAGLLGDLEGAVACLGRAAGLLQATGTDIAFRGPVMIAWAGYLSQLFQTDQALTALTEAGTEVANALLGLASEPADGPVPSTTLDKAPSSPEEPAAQRKVRLEDLQHDLDGARAAILEAQGQPAQAAQVAESAAHYWARRGWFAKAAAAFEAAGQALLKTEPERAAYLLESAVEGYQLAGQRTPRLQAAGVLIDLLNRLGRTLEAERLTESL